MEYILTSLDMFASISENLINFTFNVYFSLSFKCFYLTLLDIRCHHMRWMKSCLSIISILTIPHLTYLIVLQEETNSGYNHLHSTHHSFWILCMSCYLSLIEGWYFVLTSITRVWTLRECGLYIVQVILIYCMSALFYLCLSLY